MLWVVVSVLDFFFLFFGTVQATCSAGLKMTIVSVESLKQFFSLFTESEHVACHQKCIAMGCYADLLLCHLLPW